MAPAADEELGPPLNYNEDNDTEYPADADDMGRTEPLLKLHGTQEHPRMLSSWRDMFGEGDSHTSKVAAGIVVGAVNAMVATLFYFLLEGSLFTVWEWIPEHIWAPLVGDHFWLRHAYTVLVPTLLGLGVGLSLLYVGYPGDLPFMVYCVHHGGQIPLKHFIPMLVCASVSITGGGSLGPEAPIVLMCGCVGGLVGQWLGHKGKMMRTTTLMGMACGFAAFFGAPLGGSMFALEVLHRVGMEYFESATYAVLAGTLCCIMYHSLTGMAMGNIWNFPTNLGQPSVHNLMVGVALGFVGAATSFVFLKVHKLLGHVFESLRLKKHQLVMSTVAGCLLGVLALLVPHSFFWGEFELQSIIDRGGGLLPHIWPKDQVIAYDLGKPGPNLMVALAKMAAISITIHGGFRGGFIFPFFLTGSAVGQAIHLAIPSLHPVVCMMGVASALDVAITRTPWASALILACLSGQPNVLQPAVTAALTSLVLTYSSKFQLIKTQQTRRFSEPEPEDEWPPYDPAHGE